MEIDNKESNLNMFVKITFLSFLTAYFIYHITKGNYGILSYKNTNKILIEKKNILAKKEQDIEKQKNKITRLQSKSLDLDLLDEKLKENVGFANKNEIIIFTNDLKNI